MEKQERLEQEKKERPKYSPPEIITYDSDDLLAELGPAQACSGFTGGVVSC